MRVSGRLLSYTGRRRRRRGATEKTSFASNVCCKKQKLYTTCSSNNTDSVIAFFAFSSNCSCNFCFALKQIFSLFSSIDFDASCALFLGGFSTMILTTKIGQNFNQPTRRFNFTGCLSHCTGKRPSLCKDLNN